MDMEQQRFHRKRCCWWRDTSIKLNNCIDAIEQAFSRVHILDGRSFFIASGVLYEEGYWYRYFKRTSFLGTVLSEFFSTHFCGQFSTSFT